MTSEVLALTSGVTGFDIGVRSAVYPPNGAVDTKDSDCAEKPGFLARILEAIGRAYYVPTPDGRGIYVYPPI